MEPMIFNEIRRSMLTRIETCDDFIGSNGERYFTECFICGGRPDLDGVWIHRGPREVS